MPNLGAPDDHCHLVYLLDIFDIFFGQVAFLVYISSPFKSEYIRP